MIDPVRIMSSTPALMLATLTQNADLPIISSPSVPAKRLIMLDGANFASAEGEAPDISTSKEVLLHQEDTTPLAIASGARGSAVVASPSGSMYQTACVALRLLQDTTWAMTRSGRVAYVDGVSR